MFRAFFLLAHNEARDALYRKLGINDGSPLRGIIRLRLNTLQLVGVKRKSLPGGCGELHSSFPRLQGSLIEKTISQYF